MTSASLVRHPGPQSGAAHVTAEQDMRDPNDRYRRFDRHRRAGLYRCGPGAPGTHLERRS